MPHKRTKSNYLNIRTERSVSPNDSGYGNSLVGIGVNSKNLDKPRSSIKVFPAEYIGSMGVSISRMKTLFY
jgi:hypothetical protein